LGSAGPLGLFGGLRREVREGESWAAAQGRERGEFSLFFFNKNCFSLFCFKLLLLFEIVLDFQTF
jgi:hypothetical protein